AAAAKDGKVKISVFHALRYLSNWPAQPLNPRLGLQPFYVSKRPPKTPKCRSQKSRRNPRKTRLFSHRFSAIKLACLGLLASLKNAPARPGFTTVRQGARPRKTCPPCSTKKTRILT